MLSAIAARKAAQAASRGTSGTPFEIAEPTTPVQALPPLVSGSKRKPSLQKIPNKSKKKRKGKDNGGRANGTRYFQNLQQDSFNVQEDVITIDSEEEQGSATSEDQESYEASVTRSPLTNKRTWSPDRALDDSSNEESDRNDRNGGDIMNNHPSTPQPLSDNPDILSTFQPILDQNIFFLTPHQVHDLCIPSSSSGPGTLLALGPRETLCLLGVYSFCVLQGSICICGVTVSASSQIHPVFAPRSSPLPMLEGVSGINTVGGLERTLPEPVRSVVDTSVALVLLQDLRTGVDGLGRVCRTFDGVFKPSKWQKGGALGISLQLSNVHTVTHQTKDVQAFILPPSWEAALLSISREPSGGINNVGSVHLVKGPKKSGKSTFARTLVNKLLTFYEHVAYLECDPGQSEFTPGGMIALNVVQKPIFGPPFTHPTLPVTAHYLGATSPRSSPSHYLAAVQATLDACRLDMQVHSTPFFPNYEDADGVNEDGRISNFIPLVINTMGWTKGLGTDLNKKIEDMAHPTDVYEIEADTSTFEGQTWPLPPFPNTPQDSYPYPGPGCDVKRHLLAGIPPSVLSTSYTAADHRALSIISYFHAVFPSPSHFPPRCQADNPLLLPLSDPGLVTLTWDTSLPIFAQPPYEVDSRVFRNLVLTGAGSEDVVPAEVGIVLNAAVVGLVACQFDSELNQAGDPAGITRIQNTHTGIPYEQGRAPPSPAMSNCLGIALVRSTSAACSHLPSDPRTEVQTQVQMHILTPLPAPYLAQAKVVVKGEMELPVWGWLDHRVDVADGVAGLEQGKVPFLQWGKGPEGAVGGVRRRVRRNLMRRGQM